MLPLKQETSLEINLYGFFFSFYCECAKDGCEYDFFV